MRIDLQNAILLILILALLLTVFSFSALAATNPPLIPRVNADTIITDGISYTLDTGVHKIGTFYDDPIYIFYVAGSPTSGVFLASQTRNASYHIYNDGRYSNFSCNQNDTTTGLYYSQYSSTSALNPDIPSYSSLSSGLAAVLDYINNPNGPSNSLTYSLPAGNAIYIQVPQGASYTLKTRMPESVLGSNHFPGNNQVITLVQSLPTGGSAPTSPLIPWQQDGALSVLGLSRNAVYEASSASSGYLCIVNPLYYSGTANGPYEFLSNGSIDISVDMQTGFVVYPLDSSLGFTSGLGVNVDTTILDNPYTGEIDPETGEIIWQDSDGGTTAPTTGGGNLVSTSETIFDFLRNIGDEIATFLKGPIQAIQTVVSAIREFLGSFTQLYMWLPSPVYNLITSALMIALTIGVIKIFV